MAWYAIRSVYLFERKPDGTNVFEERVVCFRADSWSEAHTKAGKEAEEYARSAKLEVFPHQVGYEQDGEELIDGYELWSVLYESSQNLKEFYTDRPIPEM